MRGYYSQKKEVSDLKIGRYCLIKKSRVICNGGILHEEPSRVDLRVLLANLYRAFEFDYPKFHKMDLLSKLGFLTAEILLCKGDICHNYKNDEMAIIISNSNASLETDTQYFETIADPDFYYPNPGLFVYTLPNIMIGEICIRYNITGESIFYVSRQIETDFLWRTVSHLFRTTPVKAVITGWVDLDVQHNYESVLYLIEKADPASLEGQLIFDPETMEDILSDDLKTSDDE